jgi:hypothetical protein
MNYDDIAASLIPDVEGDQGDPIWKGASRLLFADIARKLKEKLINTKPLFFSSFSFFSFLTHFLILKLPLSLVKNLKDLAKKKLKPRMKI